MIGPAYIRTMAAYNSEMNRRLYAAAAQLTDAQRRADRGAFWGSIQGTLCHLVWGDRQWMSRFANWPKPEAPLGQSASMIEDFNELTAERVKADAGLEEWAASVDEAWLEQDLVWFSGAARKEMRRNRAFLVAHFFNHQTHHRGQAHAMLTACDQATGDTDLMLLLDGPK